MKKYLYLLTVIVTFSACHRNDFTVTGNVSDAEGKTLYFEATQIDKIVTLDSIKLKSDGKFTFYAPKTEFPEFYRLRLGSSYIHFAIDSTETVTFQTSGKSFTDYSVEGSEENKQIQEVSKAGSLLKNEVDKILSNTGTSDSIRIANAKRLLNALDQYKKTTPSMSCCPPSWWPAWSSWWSPCSPRLPLRRLWRSLRPWANNPPLDMEPPRREIFAAGRFCFPALYPTLRRNSR